MQQTAYVTLTSHVGMYLCYVIPIVYFLILVLGSVASHMKKGSPLGAKEISALVAIGIISLDFVRFVYLFSSGTGKLLPPAMLFAKYALGALVWLWVLWYSYETHFSRRIAGDSFAKRVTTLVVVCVASLLLGGLGIVMS